MKALVLSAGYATRLYPLTINTSKPLLKVANKPVINYIIENLETDKEINLIYVITNNKFHKDFLQWHKENRFKKPVKIINDGSTSEENRLGAIGDISFAIKKEKIKEDLLIIAGDNLFQININNLVSYFKEKDSTIIVTRIFDDLEVMKSYGNVFVDANNKVISFEEKPQNPKTNLAAACLYIIPKNKLKQINAYLKEKNNPDAPGFLMQWLYRKEDVYAFKSSDTFFHIGNKEQLEEANRYFSSLLP